jgi:hypothetical protein
LSNAGTNNLFAGGDAGSANTTGTGNSFVGSLAGRANTAGYDNSFVGYSAGRANTAGVNNSFVGAFSGGANTTGSDNSFFGRNAGRMNTTSGSNSFVGSSAGETNTTGNYNSFFGRSSGISNTEGIYNSFVGAHAGYDNTTGSSNSFAGFEAGSSNTTGGGNSFFGLAAGNTNTTGSNNTIIGTNADVGAGNLNFAAAIGAGAVVSTSNTIALGRTTGEDKVLAYGGISLSDNDLRLRAADDAFHRIRYDSSFNGMQFDTFDDYRWFNHRNNRNNMILESGGNLKIAGSYGQTSDSRYKINVQTFGNALDTVRRLRGVTFNWKPELNKNPEAQVGFIAQEVEAVLPALVSTGKDGYKSVAYSNAVPVLVEAVKEQQTQIETQAAEIKQQQKQIDELKQIVCALKPDAAVCKQQ